MMLLRLIEQYLRPAIAVPAQRKAPFGQVKGCGSGATTTVCRRNRIGWKSGGGIRAGVGYRFDRCDRTARDVAVNVAGDGVPLT